MSRNTTYPVLFVRYPLKRGTESEVKVMGGVDTLHVGWTLYMLGHSIREHGEGAMILEPNRLKLVGI